MIEMPDATSKINKNWKKTFSCPSGKKAKD
jgi:hypothetical protein